MPPSPAKPKGPERLRAERWGRRAETLAALFLNLKGYRIRERRFKTPVGELDLVVSRFGVTVFVEVKARRQRRSKEAALRAVNRARVVRAAQYYLARHPELGATPMRFDVIFLAPRAWPLHVVAAFVAN